MPVTPAYLRLSVTSRCNLRCVYCRPGTASVANETRDAFSPKELGLLVRCAVDEGVRKVRVTGGEPLVRDDLPEIVRAVASAGVHETTLTTNGIGLDARGDSLKRAGLTRVNISLDTLRSERFSQITGYNLLGRTLDGIRSAAETFDGVKLNTVLLRGINDDEIEALVRFAARHGVGIRFIERYAAHGTGNGIPEGISVGEVKVRLETLFGPLRGGTPADLSVEQPYIIPSLGDAKVGLIASATAPPCSQCAKLRFTAEGKIQACLFSDHGADIAHLLHTANASGIRRVLRDTFAAKRRSGPGASPCVPCPVNQVGG